MPKTAPGVYPQSFKTNSAQFRLIRSDIAAFIGFTTHGPVYLPVRIQSWKDFKKIFGEPIPSANLAWSVKSFFENGGKRCYVVRLTSTHARTAKAIVPTESKAPTESGKIAHWQFQASYNGMAINSGMTARKENNHPSSPKDKSNKPNEIWLNQNLKVYNKRISRLPDPGQWGNRLSLMITPTARLHTHINPGILEQGFMSELAHVDGLEPHSVLRLSQTGHGDSSQALTHATKFSSIDTTRNVVTWPNSLLDIGFDTSRPITVKSIDWRVDLTLNDRIVESYEHLTIDLHHSRSLLTVINRQSRYISVNLISASDGKEIDNSTIDASSADYWPSETRSLLFQGGWQGLAELTKQHFLIGLAALKKIKEISIVAIPDLVSGSKPLKRKIPTLTVPNSSHLANTSLIGTIFGRVLTQISDGILEAIKGVKISAIGRAHAVYSDNEGCFTLSQLPLGKTSIWLEKIGFEPTELTANASTRDKVQCIDFCLPKLDLPPALSLSDQLEVQQAMVKHAEQARYRIALLDPPNDYLNPTEIMAWRAKFNSSYAALYYPWIKISIQNSSLFALGHSVASSSILHLPPSGHIAGVIAHSDLTRGPKQAAVNIPLKFCKGLQLSINEKQYSTLINTDINLILNKTDRDFRIQGAKTLKKDAIWQSLNVRRFFQWLEHTIERSLEWVVFEPNQVVLRQAICASLTKLLNQLWQEGALAGRSESTAYQVKCDETNNSESPQNRGQFLAEVAVAPLVSNEFIHLRIIRRLNRIRIETQ